MTIATPSDTPWTLDEFVDQLNAQVPLDSTQDARRAQAWNPRLVRHYTTSKALSAPEKQGRQAFYGPQHLDEARRLTSLQNAGVSAKSVAMLASSLESTSPAVPSQPADPRQRALSLLSGWQNAPVKGVATSAHVPATPAAFVPVHHTVSDGLSWNAQDALPLGLNPTSFGDETLNEAFAAGVTGSTPRTLTASTNALQGAATPSRTPGEQWHRWSPLPGVDIALREDLWGREAELRQLLDTWVQTR